MSFRIVVDKKNVQHFTAGTINLKLDSIASTFEFAARFNAQNIEHQELFKPLQYKDVEIYNTKDKLIFTGTILNHRFKSNSTRELVIISGYSKSGILEDVTIPLSAYPLESNNRSLKDIAERLCGLFGIKVLISNQGKTITDTIIKDKPTNIRAKSDFETIKSKSNILFGRTSAGPTETVKDYLSKLAGQKNIILSHNEKGEVLLFQPDLLQKPKYFFTKGNSIAMSMDINGQSLHSDIIVVRQPSDENEGVSTVDSTKNTLIGKYRPTTKILSSGVDTETKDAAENELASELKNITATVELQGLFDEIYPGEIVNVHNHYIYNYAYNRWLVDSITLKFDEKSDTTTLNLVPPESFSGDNPRNLFFNHNDPDNHLELHLNEYNSEYTNNQNIL
jgi:prophage tail gpP-like protein